MRKSLASKLAITATFAALVTMLPVKFDPSHPLAFNSALAGNGHGNGNGGGNGNAGGNGNGARVGGAGGVGFGGGRCNGWAAAIDDLL